MSDFDYKRFSENFVLQLDLHSVNISRIKDIDKLFVHLLKKENQTLDIQDERMPYWSDIWPSAIALSKYIDENPKIVQRKKVLELGCGLGMPGIVAAMNGAVVTMTDYLPEALMFAKSNWEKNLDIPFNGQLLDWRNSDKIEKADVILASDVAYESRSFEPLKTAFKNLLKPGGVLLLTEPNRKFTSPFIELLKEDFEITKSDKKIVLDGINYVVSIYSACFS